MNGKLIAGLIAAALLGAAAFGVMRAVDAQRPKGTDTEQLLRMLAQGEAAAERRDAPSVCRLISENYSDSLGFSDSSVKYNIRSYIQEHRTIELTIPREKIQVRISPDGKTGNVDFLLIQHSRGGGAAEMPISLKVAREPVHYFLMFPGEEWRVTAADGYMGMAGVF